MNSALEALTWLSSFSLSIESLYKPQHAASVAVCAGETFLIRFEISLKLLWKSLKINITLSNLEFLLQSWASMLL